jgi:hypothetical protein
VSVAQHRPAIRTGRGRPGIARDCTRNRDIRLGWPDGDWEALPGPKATWSNSRCCTHGHIRLETRNCPTRRGPPWFTAKALLGRED